MRNPAHSALLLEDEPLIAIDIEQILDAAGFDVTSVSTCAQANAWLQTHRPDVAVLDIELRDGSCHTVAAGLNDQGVPFIVHSGDIPALHRDTPFVKGAWVTKPSAPEDLLAALRGAIVSHS